MSRCKVAVLFAFIVSVPLPILEAQSKSSPPKPTAAGSGKIAACSLVPKDFLKALAKVDRLRAMCERAARLHNPPFPP